MYINKKKLMLYILLQGIKIANYLPNLNVLLLYEKLTKKITSIFGTLNNIVPSAYDV